MVEADNSDMEGPLDTIHEQTEDDDDGDDDNDDDDKAWREEEQELELKLKVLKDELMNKIVQEHARLPEHFKVYDAANKYYTIKSEQPKNLHFSKHIH